MRYDQRYDQTSMLLGEALAPYVAAAETGPFAKVSISVPAPLLAAVREVAEASGSTVSGVITATLRRIVDEAEQARLDAALDADRDENLAWARATTSADATLVAKLEW